LSIPTHALVGWENTGGAQKFYGGGRFTGREYPFAVPSREGDDLLQGWAEGYVTTVFLGLRTELFRPLYLAIEAGAQKESLTFYSEGGATIGGYSTAFTPWVGLALETHISPLP
jgi:hypothetical protein